mmetsp:Transcript_10013/g.23401  ORF Transcript_10013/g.23401 Transcript_10013/m.23401 type:complete len:272 (+) Transcript_10013:716-1531(+)
MSSEMFAQSSFCLSLPQMSSTMWPCCSPRAMFFIILSQAESQSSCHEFSISCVQLSPTACSMTVTMTWPRMGVWCGLAPYLTCLAPSQATCSRMCPSSSAKDTSVHTISTNFMTITCRVLLNICFRLGAIPRRVSYSMPPSSSSEKLSIAMSHEVCTSEEASSAASSARAMDLLSQSHTYCQAFLTSDVHSLPRQSLSMCMSTDPIATIIDASTPLLMCIVDREATLSWSLAGVPHRPTMSLSMSTSFTAISSRQRVKTCVSSVWVLKMVS